MYMRRFMVSAPQAINHRQRQWKNTFDQGLVSLNLRNSNFLSRRRHWIEALDRALAAMQFDALSVR